MPNSKKLCIFAAVYCNNYKKYNTQLHMAMTTTRKFSFISNARAYRRSAMLILVFIFFALQAGAQNFSSTSAYRSQNQNMQPTMTQLSDYQVYQSTIYEPFSSEMPSSYNSPAQITGRRNIDENDFGFEDEANKSNESPLGDAWSLLIFAAIGAGVIFIKQRKNLKAKA